MRHTPPTEFKPRNAARRCQLTPALLLRGFSIGFGDILARGLQYPRVLAKPTRTRRNPYPWARVLGFWSTGTGSPGKLQGYPWWSSRNMLVVSPLRAPARSVCTAEVITSMIGRNICDLWLFAVLFPFPTVHQRHLAAVEGLRSTINSSTYPPTISESHAIRSLVFVFGPFDCVLDARQK
jgi:hypothetical protein